MVVLSLVRLVRYLLDAYVRVYLRTKGGRGGGRGFAGFFGGGKKGGKGEWVCFLVCDAGFVRVAIKMY